jgi:hypothetical protein
MCPLRVVILLIDGCNYDSIGRCLVDCGPSDSILPIKPLICVFWDSISSLSADMQSIELSGTQYAARRKQLLALLKDLRAMG